MQKYKKNKEADELRTIQAKADKGAFADDTSQNAKKGADLVQLAADSEEQSEEKTLQKIADTQAKSYAGNSGGDDKPSNNGIPNDMQKGFEQYSGTSFDNVKVHKNSSKPKQLKAHAYAQGNEVHLGPGQEKHLPHELGHVVQQRKGMVKPTKVENGQNVNDDPKLEKGADQIAQKVSSLKTSDKPVSENKSSFDVSQLKVVQKEGEVDEAKQDAENAQDQVQDGAQNATDAAADAKEQVEGAVENADEVVGDAKEGAQAEVDEAVEAAQTFNVAGELSKKNFKQEFSAPPTPLLPPLPLVMKPYFNYDVSYVATGAADMAETSASMDVATRAAFAGGIKVDLDAVIAKAGLDAKIEALLPEDQSKTNDASVKWSKEGGFEGNMKITGAVNAGINGYFELLFFRHELQLANVKIADIVLDIGDGKVNSAKIDFVWQPKEGDLIDTSKFFAWLSEDDEAANQVAGLSNEEVNQLPSGMKAELLSKIRDVFVGQKHEEQMLRLMGIIKGTKSTITDVAWEVMMSAYSKDHDGAAPTGYEQVFEWLHTKMDGTNDEAMEEAATQDKIIDIQLDGEIDGEENGVPKIILSDYTPKRVGGDISTEDKEYFKGLIQQNKFTELMSGVDAQGNPYKISTNIAFSEGNYTMIGSSANSTVKGYDPSSIYNGLKSATSSL